MKIPHSLTHRPFRAFRWAIYFYLIVCFAYAPQGMIQNFRLSGAIDYWVVDRAMAPFQGGLASLLARIGGGAPFVDAVPAFGDKVLSLLLYPLVQVMQPWQAASLLAILWPLVLLAVLFAVLPKMGALALPSGTRQLSVYFLLFAPDLLRFFMPGSLDPSSYAFLCMALFVACLARAGKDPAKNILWLVGSGLALLGSVVFMTVLDVPAPQQPMAWGEDLRQMTIPLLGSLGALAAIVMEPTRRRQIWILHAGLLALSMAGASDDPRLWAQAQLFALVPTTWLFLAFWRLLASLGDRPRRYLLEAGLIVLFGLGPVLLLPLGARGAALAPDLLFAPALRSVSSCDVRMVTDYFETPWREERAQAKLLNDPWDGPEILFRTKAIEIVSLPFDPKGIEAARTFAEAENDEQARVALEKTKASHVAFCAKDKEKLGKYQLKLVNNKGPAWLKRVEIPFDNDYLLFRFEKGGEKSK